MAHLTQSFKPLALAFAAALFAATAVTQADVVFFDDFQDETLGSVPAIDAINDVGDSWTFPGSVPGSTDIGNHAGGTAISHRSLDLGAASSNGATNAAAIANFDATAVSKGIVIDGATVSFDFFIDRTGAGSTTATLKAFGGGDKFMHLIFKRGNDLRMQINVNGTITDISGLGLNNNDNGEWRHIELTLGESSFDISITQEDGAPGAFNATSVAYFDGTTPVYFDSLRLEDNANNSGRRFWVDNVTVDATVVPTPAALPAGLAMIGLAAARRRRSIR